jgi:hypothetical protein
MALGAAILGAAGISAAGSLLGGLFGGRKPKVPELKPINFEQEQTNAIRQNIAALEPATKLAEKTTSAEQSLLETQLRRAIPGYDQIVQQAGQNIGAALRGELSPEVSAQVQRSTAGRALSGGFGAGSGFGRSLTARDLGLTSMQIQNQGLAQAQNFIQQQRAFGMAQPFSVSSMFITPAQRIGAIQEQQARMYGRDLTAAQVAAAPSPFQQAIGSTLSNVGNIAGGALMQYGLYKAMLPTAGGAGVPGTSPSSGYGFENSGSISGGAIDYSTGEMPMSPGTPYTNPMSPATLYAVPPSSFYPGIR